MKIGAWESDSGRCFVIAECGINHQGSMDMAREMVRVAREELPNLCPVRV